MSASIPTFSDRPKAAPTPKLRALVKYPGNIVGGTGIDVTKQHGTVTIDMDWSEFSTLSSAPTSPTNFVLTFDTATQTYVMVPASSYGNISYVDAQDSQRVLKAGDTMTGTLGISMPAGGLTHAFDVTQTVDGTLAHPNLYIGNNFQFTDNSDSYALGYNFNMSLNNAAWRGFKTAMQVNAFVNVAPTTPQSTINDYNITAFCPSIAGNVSVDPARLVSLFAFNPLVTLADGVTGYDNILGAEFDLGAGVGSSVNRKIGVQVISSGPVNGTLNADVAYLIGAFPGSATWDYGLSWYADTFTATSTIIGSLTTTASGRGIDFRSVTFASDAFASPGFRVDRLGSITSTQLVKSVGYYCLPGISSTTYSGSVFNIDFIGGVNNLWIDNFNFGYINVTSDYRIKKDVIDLPEMWETVKSLRPIKYTQADFDPPSAIKRNAPMFVADDIERWGFIAHELQETLTPSAATGVKDQPDLIQSPNPFTLLAALTKTLQEAMARIEALEGQLAKAK
jgi:hypothetical protein